MGNFWALSYSTSINDALWLLNWIIFWIESAEFILNWIIIWIESWVKQYWIKYWMNHFLAKFKHWIESDWVSPTTIYRLGSVLSANYKWSKIVPKLVESLTITSFWTIAYTNSLFCHFIQHGFWHLLGRDFKTVGHPLTTV